MSVGPIVAGDQSGRFAFGEPAGNVGSSDIPDREKRRFQQIFIRGQNAVIVGGLDHPVEADFRLEGNSVHPPAGKTTPE